MAISRMLVVSPRCSKICQSCAFLSPFRILLFTVGHLNGTFIFLTTKFQVNSNVICASSIIGALVSAVCYLRVIIFLRTRDSRSTNIESALLVTSFVLFCALCALAGYFVCILLSVGENWKAFYFIRKHSYAFSFFISLANPWCLMVTS
ncbi:hypothetical protein PFISCL1PPCAC_13518, partial [Pristionchus fissidentatus]